MVVHCVLPALLLGPSDLKITLVAFSAAPDRQRETRSQDPRRSYYRINGGPSLDGYFVILDEDGTNPPFGRNVATLDRSSRTTPLQSDSLQSDSVQSESLQSDICRRSESRTWFR